MKTIYLSGPIMDVVDDNNGREAKEWRSRAKHLLKDSFNLLDPMRRNFRDKEVDSSNEIVEFDLLDVKNADVLLVNYSKASVGTSMEVFHASHNLGKFVVGFSPFDFVNCSPWMVKYCTKILPNVKEACDYIQRHFAGT